MAWGAIFKAVGEAAKEAGKEVGKEVAKKADTIEKRKVADNLASKGDSIKPAENAKAQVNIEKRIVDKNKEKPTTLDTNKKFDFMEELGKALDQYKKELLENSPFPDSLNLDKLKPSEIKKVTKEKLKEARDEFKNNKDKLISEWEQQTGKKWPRYKHDVIKDGVTIKKAGELYDAHHIKPLSWGGENVASNITPMEWTPHHLKVHGKDSGYNKVSELLKNKEGAN